MNRTAAATFCVLQMCWEFCVNNPATGKMLIVHDIFTGANFKSFELKKLRNSAELTSEQRSFLTDFHLYDEVPVSSNIDF